MPLAKKSDKKFTYADYLTWSDDERWEIIEGIAYNMTPAPSTKHQLVLGNFFHFLKDKLKGKPCTPFISPIDVIFSEYNVVQPDLIVVCDKKKITHANIQGAPDLIVEVRSPYTALTDMREKKILYEKYSVREYVIIDPLENYVERYSLIENGGFGKGDIFADTDALRLISLPDIEIPLSEVFEVEGEEVGKG